MAVQPAADPRIVRIGASFFVNADCVAGAAEHLADESVDLIVTDPPYGIEGDRLHRHYHRDESFVAGDYVDVPVKEYNAFSHRWIREAERVLRPGGSLYIVSGYTNLYDVLDALRATRLREINHLIWKYNFGVYTAAKYVSSHYHILYYAKPGGRRTFNLQARHRTDETLADGGSANYRDREDVWTINRAYKPGRAKNKNELPEALLEKMLAYSSNAGDLVCDFFLGGGSTAAVAIGMNRRVVGFEVSAETFARHIPRLRAVVPASRLTPVVAPHTVRNRGVAWSPAERERVYARFDALRASGATKKASIATLTAEFGRGPWAILNVINARERVTPSVPASSGSEVARSVR
jgi:site-specific DNA-methyltransferase (adenine-specific)